MMSDPKPVLKFKCVDGGAIECKWEGSSTDENFFYSKSSNMLATTII